MVFVLAALFAPFPLAAQRVEAGMVDESYRYRGPEPADVHLTAVPYHAALRAGWVGFDLGGTVARIDLNGFADTSSARVSDVEWGVSVAPPSGSFFIRVGGDVVGDKAGTYGEALVLGFLGGELVPYAIARRPTATTMGVDAGAELPVGDVRLGLAAGGQAPVSPDPLQLGAFTYRASSEVHASATVERVVHRTGSLFGRAAFQRFFDDELNGTPLYRAGSRIDLAGSYSAPIGLRGSGQLYGTLRILGAADVTRATTRDTEAVRAKLALLVPGLNGTGAERVGVVGGRLRVEGRRIAAIPEVELRVLAADGGILDWIGSAALGAEVRVAGGRLGPRLVVAPEARYRRGRTRSAEGDLDVDGWQIGASGRLVWP
jgi:hypothetical protein